MRGSGLEDLFLRRLGVRRSIADPGRQAHFGAERLMTSRRYQPPTANPRAPAPFPGEAWRAGTARSGMTPSASSRWLEQHKERLIWTIAVDQPAGSRRGGEQGATLRRCDGRHASPRWSSPCEARFDSDLTDAEWLLVAPLIRPAKHGGRPRTADVREVLNAIFYGGGTPVASYVAGPSPDARPLDRGQPRDEDTEGGTQSADESLINRRRCAPPPSPVQLQPTSLLRGMRKAAAPARLQP